MRLPEWARNDNRSKLKFFIQIMSAYSGPECTVLALTDAAGLHYNSVLRAQENGRMSNRLAVALAKAAAGSGVKAIWLIAPEMVETDDEGEIRK